MGRRRQSVGNVIRKNKCHFFGSCPNGSVAARIFEGCFKDHCWSGTTYPTPIQFSWRLVFNAAVDDCSSKRIAYLTIFFLERIFLFFDCFCRRRCGTSVLGNDDDDVGVVSGMSSSVAMLPSSSQLVPIGTKPMVWSRVSRRV